jgi:hypothetical protein
MLYVNVWGRIHLKGMMNSDMMAKACNPSTQEDCEFEASLPT